MSFKIPLRRGRLEKAGPRFALIPPPSALLRALSVLIVKDLPLFIFHRSSFIIPELPMPNPRKNELRFDTFQSAPKKTTKGYEILCIHSDQANGWNFKADVLQESVKFFESSECFTDHNMFGESVHGLAGLFSNPRWDDSQQGIIADLRPTGPAAELLRAYADEMLSDTTPRPNMGFSPVLRADFPCSFIRPTERAIKCQAS